MTAALHPELARVFDRFAQAGLRWCLVRGEDELGAPDRDVDLLIAPADAARAGRLLATLGFRQLPTAGRGSHALFIGYDAPGDRWLTLDLVTELAYGPYFALRTPAAAGCLARRQRAGPICVLTPDDAFWTLLLHCLLDQRRFAPHRARRLQALAPEARTDGPLARMVSRVCPDGLSAAHLVGWARQGEWPRLERLAPPLVAAWARQQPIRTAWRVGTGWLLRRLEPVLAALRRPGLAVALLGPDGAGKSTVAAAIRDDFPFPVRLVYMGLWQQPEAEAAGPRCPGQQLAARLLTVWRRYLRGWCHRALGRLVIFDRYTYDALLVPRRPGHWRERLYYGLLSHACPAPGLVFLLDAPGRLMYQRKGEDSPEVLEAQRERFLALAGRIPRLRVVDATRPRDAVRREIVQQIWRGYVAGR